MESALYGIYALVVFVSQILLVRQQRVRKYRTPALSMKYSLFISDAIYRPRKQVCFQKVNFRYFRLKSGGMFAFRFPSSRPFSLFLFSFLVLGIYWASFR